MECVLLPGCHSAGCGSRDEMFLDTSTELAAQLSRLLGTAGNLHHPLRFDLNPTESDLLFQNEL